MVAVAVAPDAVEPDPGGSRSARRRRPRVGRAGILLVAAVYFAVPFYAALRFALTSATKHWTADAFTRIPSQEGFSAAFTLSMRLAAVTTALTLGLMVPTAVYVHLRLPKLRRVLDGITILPIVIPPIVLVIGVLQVMPSTLKGTPYLLALEYVVLAMPFAYRSLDAGLGAIDLATLVEASRSLGAGWGTTFRRVLLPNLRAALLSATVLTIALVLGEFTLASLDQYQTLPVWIVSFQQDDSHVSTAVSLAAIAGTSALLVVIGSFDGRRRRAPR